MDQLSHGPAKPWVARPVQPAPAPRGPWEHAPGCSAAAPTAGAAPRERARPRPARRPACTGYLHLVNRFGGRNSSKFPVVKLLFRHGLEGTAKEKKQRRESKGRETDGKPAASGATGAETERTQSAIPGAGAPDTASGDEAALDRASELLWCQDGASKWRFTAAHDAFSAHTHHVRQETCFHGNSSGKVPDGSATVRTSVENGLYCVTLGKTRSPRLSC